jgi:hypothetical protein
VTVAIVALVGWTIGINAIFFAIVAMQFLRLKYATSYYTRYCFDSIDKSALALLPAVIYRFTFKFLNGWVAGAMKKRQEEMDKQKK